MRSRPTHGKKCDGTLAKTDRRARCGRTEVGTKDNAADEVFTQVPSWQTSHLEFLR